MQLIYKEGPPIFNHVNEFQGLLDQLSNVGVKFDDEILGLWLLNTLPDSWETFRVSHTNYAPNGVMTMDYAKSGILNEEVRRKLKVHFHKPRFWLPNKGEDRRIELMTKVEVEANPNRGTRILNVIIVTRKATSRRIVSSRRMRIIAMVQDSLKMVVLIVLPPPQMEILLLFLMTVPLI